MRNDSEIFGALSIDILYCQLSLDSYTVFFLDSYTFKITCGKNNMVNLKRNLLAF